MCPFQDIDIRILLVDDHCLILHSLAQCLDREAGLTVVGVAIEPEEAVNLATRLHPDIVIMDIDLGGMNGFCTADRIVESLPEVRLVFLSAFTYDRYITRAVELGAKGYVSKDEDLGAVVDAVRRVAAGGRYFSPNVLLRLVVGADGMKVDGDAVTRVSTLTPREIQILTGIAAGLPKKNIAKSLSISVKTVESHCVNLMAKLGIHDRVELARFAIREGLIPA